MATKKTVKKPAVKKATSAPATAPFKLEIPRFIRDLVLAGRTMQAQQILVDEGMLPGAAQLEIFKLQEKGC